MELNQKELAELLGITARQVRNLKEQGLFELIKGSKKYNAAACVQEYIQHKIKAETGRGAHVNKEQEQAEHEKLKKEITALKLRKMRKEVHEASDVEAFWTDCLLEFRRILLSIPSKIAPKFLNEADVNVIVNTLNEEMITALDALSEYDPDKINKDNVNYFAEGDDENNDEPDADEIL